MVSLNDDLKATHCFQLYFNQKCVAKNVIETPTCFMKFYFYIYYSTITFFLSNYFSYYIFPAKTFEWELIEDNKRRSTSKIILHWEQNARKFSYEKKIDILFEQNYDLHIFSSKLSNDISTRDSTVG